MKVPGLLVHSALVRPSSKKIPSQNRNAGGGGQDTYKIVQFQKSTEFTPESHEPN